MARMRNADAAPAEQAEAPAVEAEQDNLDVKAAAEKRAAARTAGGTTEDDRKRDAIAALLAERRGYVQRDLGDRIGQVDEQLDRLGYKA